MIVPTARVQILRVNSDLISADRSHWKIRPGAGSAGKFPPSNMDLIRFSVVSLRLRLWLAAVMSLCFGAVGRSEPVKFDVPAQPAALALLAFAKQAGVEVLFSYSELKEVRSTKVTGTFEPRDAIELLL